MPNAEQIIPHGQPSARRDLLLKTQSAKMPIGLQLGGTAMKFIVGVISAAILILAHNSAQAASFTIEYVEKPGADFTNLWDINNSGVAVGSTNLEAFIYSGGMFTTLMVPNSVNAAALGISDTGVIVGSYEDSTTSVETGFIYDGMTYQAFSIPGATFTQFRGISPDGRFVSGYYTDANNVAQGFVLDRTDDSVRLIGGGGDLTMDGHSFTIPQGINSSYTLVGSDTIIDSMAPGGFLDLAFIYDLNTDTRTNFEIAGVTNTTARAIDDAGNIAGWYVDGSGNLVGFSGYPGSIMVLQLNPTFTVVQGSNNAGFLVGYLDPTNDGRAFIATPTEIPLPAAFMLFLFGLAGLSFTRRDKASRAIA